MEKSNDTHIENDKIRAPFLLAASFCGLVQFVGNFVQDGVLYWKFTPKDKALQLIDQLNTKTEPHIPSSDLFTAITFFWEKIAELRNGGMKNGRSA